MAGPARAIRRSGKSARSGIPTWLAQPAALVPGSKLIDAPPANVSLETVTAQAKDYELAVMHTSSPSFPSDAKVAQALKDANPALKIGFVGAKVAVQPEESLRDGAAIDFVARNEFDFTIKEVAEGRDLSLDRRAVVSRRQRRDRAQQGPRDPVEHGRAAVRHRKSTSATCASRTTSSAT